MPTTEADAFVRAYPAIDLQSCWQIDVNPGSFALVVLSSVFRASLGGTMGAVIVLPFLLLFLWFIGGVMYSMMGWWAVLMLPVVALLAMGMWGEEQKKQKAKLMRKELRREQRDQLAAEWDRRHGGGQS